MNPLFSLLVMFICFSMVALNAYTYKLQPKLNPLGPFLMFLWSAMGLYWGYLGVTGL